MTNRHLNIFSKLLVQTRIKPLPSAWHCLFNGFFNENLKLIKCTNPFFFSLNTMSVKDCVLLVGGLEQEWSVNLVQICFRQ